MVGWTTSVLTRTVCLELIRSAFTPMAPAVDLERLIFEMSKLNSFSTVL